MGTGIPPAPDPRKPGPLPPSKPQPVPAEFPEEQPSDE
jgi:hypothetical protein